MDWSGTSLHYANVVVLARKNGAILGTPAFMPDLVTACSG